MNLPSTLALGGSLGVVPQRRSCMAPSGVVKVAVTAGALSKVTMKNTAQVSFFAHVMCCTYNNISKCAGATLNPHRETRSFSFRGERLLEVRRLIPAASYVDRSSALVSMKFYSAND